ncbi:MAG: BrnT family toxin [Desulfobacterales bacterium]|nr:BrnT family toxin [Desulfobacterales bacterium]
MNFTWDENKNNKNIEKHGVSFYTAQYAFQDKQRIILEDVKHSESESRFFCLGKIEGKVLTVRFTVRGNQIRIFGAGFWKKGEKRYEKENSIHE